MGGKLTPIPEGGGGEFSTPLFPPGPGGSLGRFLSEWGGVGGPHFEEMEHAPPPDRGGVLGPNSVLPPGPGGK